MNVIASKTDNLLKVVIVDLLLISAICLIPATSHVLAFPLYKLNPMLLALFAGMALVGDRRNAFLLAVMLPLASMLATGMPLAANAVCMVPELAAVVALMLLFERRLPLFVAAVASALAGKVVFYLLRALLFAPATLFGTSLLLQFAAILASALLYVAIRRVNVK